MALNQLIYQLFSQKSGKSQVLRLMSFHLTICRMCSLENKANETLLILKTNSKMIADLRLEYKSLLEKEYGQNALGIEHADMDRFQQRLYAIQQDMEMQRCNIDMFIRMVADRKNLVSHLHTVPRCLSAKHSKVQTILWTRNN